MVGIRGAQEGELVAELGGLTISQQLKSMVHHRLNICSKLRLYSPRAHNKVGKCKMASFCIFL